VAKVLFDAVAWPPSESLVWQHCGKSETDIDGVGLEEIAPLNAQELTLIGNRLKDFSGPILESIVDIGDRQREEIHLAASVRSIEGWSAQIAEAAGEVKAEHYINGRAWKHSCESIFSAVRFSAGLKGGVEKVEASLLVAIGLVAPPAIVGTLCRSFASNPVDHDNAPIIYNNKVASATTIHRNSFSVDLAMMRDRRINYSLDWVRYLWSDSSPQAEYDWLWSQIHEIHINVIVETFHAANRLQLMITLFVEQQQVAHNADTSGHIAPSLEPLECWRSLLQTLKNIKEHIYHPTAVASGQRGLPHKIAAELHQWHFDVPVAVSLNAHADTFECHTSDMGIEISMPDFEVDNVDDLLPPWLQREDLHADIGDTPRNTATPRRGGHFMNNALTIYGLQHAANNINCDVHKSLTYWEEFWKQLKNFEALLGVGERRRRFIWTCIRGTTYDNQSHLLKKFSGSLYEKRWNCVLTFLKKLKSLLPIFRRCWDHEKFANNTDGNGAAFKDDAEGDAEHTLGMLDLVALSATIHDNFFNRFVDFAFSVESVPTEAISSWGEGCHCHEPLFRSGLHSPDGRAMSEYKRRQLLKTHFGAGYRTCPKLDL